MIERFGLSEADLRQRAMEWLAARGEGRDTFTYGELHDFAVAGERLPLKDRVKGIWKPAGFSAALSITTTFRPPGAEKPYEDDVSGDLSGDMLLRYKWDGADPEAATNRSLRAAMQYRAPLIWFRGIAKGRFEPCFPIYVVGEDHQQQEFIVSLLVVEDAVDPAAAEYDRRYRNREVLQRLHQAAFRREVLGAYRNRCAVCNLGHPQLLDAAHIVPDRDDDGIPSVVNGIALCKLHHAAFDARLLGIRPDLVVQVKPDLLIEFDGQMVRYAFQEIDGKKVAVPRETSRRPRRDLLEIAWGRFQGS
ncbi:HNH endonuclease [Sinomonas sp. ASV322]|uniref:HNH endonuclease n=1 Tax=Sinomonas sp. ASV322 TaxID=3041920 RepID=UPI0027DE226F|nr:HNH endonuclease [Sinomonas sp. ASV322]MDQ4502544.1 HNH endonuclease [Sinomonas sp. ASV322]